MFLLLGFLFDAYKGSPYWQGIDSTEMEMVSQFCQCVILFFRITLLKILEYTCIYVVIIFSKENRSPQKKLFYPRGSFNSVSWSRGSHC